MTTRPTKLDREGVTANRAKGASLSRWTAGLLAHERHAKAAIARASPRSVTTQRALNLVADAALREGQLAECVEISERVEALAHGALDPCDLAAAGQRRLRAHLYAGDVPIAQQAVPAAERADDHR